MAASRRRNLAAERRRAGAARRRGGADRGVGPPRPGAGPAADGVRGGGVARAAHPGGGHPLGRRQPRRRRGRRSAAASSATARPSRPRRGGWARRWSGCCSWPDSARGGRCRWRRSRRPRWSTTPCSTPRSTPSAPASRWSWRSPAELPPLVGDGPSLQSAVQQPGRQRRQVRRRRPLGAGARVRRAGTPSTREVHIAVDDHGPGLDAEERRHVFEPFYPRPRTPWPTRSRAAGSGLSLVRRIVDAHGGRVELESEPGRGSTFTICLPGRQDPAHRRRAAVARRGRRPRPPRRLPEPRGRRTPAPRRRRARPAAHAERSPQRRGLCGGDGRRRRLRPGPRHLRGVRPHRPRRDAAQARRLRRLPHAAPARHHHADPDAHRPRPGGGPRRRAQARRRRLPDQAVRAARAAGAHRGAAAPGPGVHPGHAGRQPARAPAPATRSTSSSSTSARPR